MYYTLWLQTDFCWNGTAIIGTPYQTHGGSANWGWKDTTENNHCYVDLVPAQRLSSGVEANMILGCTTITPTSEPTFMGPGPSSPGGTARTSNQRFYVEVACLCAPAPSAHRRLGGHGHRRSAAARSSCSAHRRYTPSASMLKAEPTSNECGPVHDDPLARSGPSQRRECWSRNGTGKSAAPPPSSRAFAVSPKDEQTAAPMQPAPPRTLRQSPRCVIRRPRRLRFAHWSTQTGAVGPVNGLPFRQSSPGRRQGRSR